jgi:hypothetical protein
MSIKTTHRDAAATASTQVSLSEFLSDFDAEPVEDPDEEPEVDPTVDLTTVVGVGEEKGHYHKMCAVGDGEIISACPHHDLRLITLREAVEEGSKPCKVCNPTDWRVDPENAEEGV